MANFDEPQKVKPELETARSPLNLTDLAGNRSDSISQQRDLLTGADAGKALPGLMLVENDTGKTDRHALVLDDSDRFKYVPQEDPDSKWYLDGTAKPAKPSQIDDFRGEDAGMARGTGGGEPPDGGEPGPGGVKYSAHVAMRPGKVDSENLDGPWYREGSANGNYRFGDRKTALD